MRSVLLGIGLDVGSSQDGPGQCGMAHLCEHLRVSSAKARLGPQKLSRLFIEAFTEREETFFIAQALRDDCALLLEWLRHFLAVPEPSPAVFERERAVLLEEAFALASSAIDRVDAGFMAHGYEGTRYARPIAGVPDELVSIEREAALASAALRDGGARRVVALVGDLAGTMLEERAAELLQGQPVPRGESQAGSAVELRPGILEVPAGLEVPYFVLGVPAVHRVSPQRVDLYALSTHLGDGFDSQLFLELRERHALVYSIRTEYHLFRNAGHLVVKGVAAAEKLSGVVHRVREVVERTRTWTPDAERVAELRHALRKALLVNLDEPRNKLLRLLKHEFWFSTFFTVEDDLAAVECITPESLAGIARQVLGSPSLLCQGT